MNELDGLRFPYALSERTCCETSAVNATLATVQRFDATTRSPRTRPAAGRPGIALSRVALANAPSPAGCLRAEHRRAGIGCPARLDEMYDIIESCSPVPYLELFERGTRPKWSVWGNQANDSYTPTWDIYANHSHATIVAVEERARKRALVEAR